MKNFFLLLFFLKTVSLTQTPVTITNEPLEIIPEKNLSTITGGAAVYICLPDYKGKNMDFDEIEKIFPEGTVSGELITNNGTAIKIKHQGYSIGREDARLIVSGLKPIPTDIEFSKVILRSSIVLNNVDVVWINGKH